MANVDATSAVYTIDDMIVLRYRSFHGPIRRPGIFDRTANDSMIRPIRLETLFRAITRPTASRAITILKLTLTLTNRYAIFQTGAELKLGFGTIVTGGHSLLPSALFAVFVQLVGSRIVLAQHGRRLFQPLSGLFRVLGLGGAFRRRVAETSLKDAESRPHIVDRILGQLIDQTYGIGAADEAISLQLDLTRVAEVEHHFGAMQIRVGDGQAHVEHDQDGAVSVGDRTPIQNGSSARLFQFQAAAEVRDRRARHGQLDGFALQSNPLDLPHDALVQTKGGSGVDDAIGEQSLAHIEFQWRVDERRLFNVEIDAPPRQSGVGELDEPGIDDFNGRTAEAANAVSGLVKITADEPAFDGHFVVFDVSVPAAGDDDGAQFRRVNIDIFHLEFRVFAERREEKGILDVQISETPFAEIENGQIPQLPMAGADVELIRLEYDPHVAQADDLYGESRRHWGQHGFSAEAELRRSIVLEGIDINAFVDDDRRLQPPALDGHVAGEHDGFLDSVFHESQRRQRRMRLLAGGRDDVDDVFRVGQGQGGVRVVGSSPEVGIFILDRLHRSKGFEKFHVHCFFFFYLFLLKSYGFMKKTQWT